MWIERSYNGAGKKGENNLLDGKVHSDKRLACTIAIYISRTLKEFFNSSLIWIRFESISNKNCLQNVALQLFKIYLRCLVEKGYFSRPSAIASWVAETQGVFGGGIILFLILKLRAANRLSD